MKKSFAFATLAVLILSACDSASDVHNLSTGEKRRAEIFAEAHFGKDFPGGTSAAGEIIKRKGAFTQCRPQDSNDNGLVTCTGMVPNMAGGYTQTTVYCGYRSGKDAVDGCNDKDQK